MAFGELDGFLTGVSLCPEPIPEKDWLPCVQREETEPKLENPTSANALLEAVRQHHRRIAHCLFRDPQQYEAVFLEDPTTGEVLWEDWVQGFDASMQLRVPVWNALSQEETSGVASAIRAIRKLYYVSIGEADLHDTLDVFGGDDVPSLVAKLVQTIAARNSAKNLMRKQTNFCSAKLKVRRNETCSCGSGRRYKRCCGAIVPTRASHNNTGIYPSS